MKKKLAGLLVTAVMLCGCLGLSAMAAKTPSLEMMDFHATVTQNSAYNPVPHIIRYCIIEIIRTKRLNT